MPCYLGIDTSNYTTSTALYNSGTGVVLQAKKLLPVDQGKLGLKQSDAVFQHVKQLGDLLRELLAQADEPVAGVAASYAPRDVRGSYMPCFLVGLLAGQAAAAAVNTPLYRFSHQAGHVAAALYSANRLALREKPFLAFHYSGGTTECLLVRPSEAHILEIAAVAGTLDLNAGQAVDRVGGMLGLPFPAGPGLEELALASEMRYSPKVSFQGANPSLSGLENQCAALLEKGEEARDIARYCLDYLTKVILEMTRRVLETHPGLPLVYAGGVMSNRLIRAAVRAAYPAVFADPAFSSDNAAGTAVLCALAKEGDYTC